MLSFPVSFPATSNFPLQLLSEFPRKESPFLHQLFCTSVYPDAVLKRFDEENTLWQRFKGNFQKKINLATSLETLTQLEDFSASWQEHRAILIQSFASNGYVKLRPYLRVIIKKMRVEQLNELFERLVISSCDNVTRKEGSNNQQRLPLAILRCLELFTREEMEKFYSVNNPDVMTAEIIAKELSELLKGSGIEILEEKLKSQKSGFFYSMGKLIGRFFDTIAVALSFFSLGKEPGSSWDASQILSVYGKFIALPLTIFLGLNVFLPVLIALIATLGVLLLLAIGILIYIKCLKHVPENLPWGMNATKKAEQGKLTRVVARDLEIQQLLKNLMSGNPTLLLGPTGVGKTEIVKGLAQRFALGDVPDELKGMQVHIIKASRLVNDGISFDSSDNLQKLLKRVGEKAIIFLDEIHVLMNDKYKGIVEQLKTYLEDNNPEGICYFIGATNQIKTIDDEAFLDRFIQMPISISAEQTLHVLEEIVRKKALDLVISPGVLELIVKITEKDAHPQPRIAKRLLNQAITTLRIAQSAVSQSKELQQKEAEYQASCSKALSSGAHAFHTTLIDPTNIKRREEARAEMAKIKNELMEKTKKIAKMSYLNREIALQRKEFYQIANQIAAGTIGEESQKQLLFFHYTLLPILEGEKNKLSEEVGEEIPVKIDEALVKSIWNDLCIA